ncbi:hypothetical protein U1Q18_017991, partial [Sarracenia purpurea var. burkii]
KKYDGSGNRFRVLAQVEYDGSEVASVVSPRPLIAKEEDETPPPPAITVTEKPNPTDYSSDKGAEDEGVTVWTPSSGRKVIEEDLCWREDLTSLLKNKSIDKESIDLFRVEKFNLESEIRDYSICPNHLLSKKMAIIEARIRKLKGLSPVKGNADVSVAVKEGSPGSDLRVGDSGVPLLDHQVISYKPEKLVSEFATDEGSEVKGVDAGVEINTAEIEVDNGAFSAGGEEIEVAPGIESFAVTGTEEGGEKIQVFSSVPPVIFCSDFSIIPAEDCRESVDLLRSSECALMDKQLGDCVGIFSKAHQVFDEMSSTQKPVDLCASAAEKQLPGGILKSRATKKVSEEEFAEGTKEVVSNKEQGIAGLAPKKVEILPKANRNAFF